MELAVATRLMIALLTEGLALQQAIAKAQAEGRPTLSDDEVASFAGRDDGARLRLQAKIDALPIA